MSFNAAAELLRQAKRVAVLTGAGISAESGIPTFRDAMTGLWERFKAEDLATPQAFRRDPPLVWGWYEWRRMQVMQTRPNPGHLALAELATRIPTTLVTQNVDNLHERAGSKEVLHVHGSLFAPRCFDCGTPVNFSAAIPDEPEGGRRLPPPACSTCGGDIRPGIVWFGEGLPQDVWDAAERAERAADVLISVGTSGLVYPAAALPEIAYQRGTPIIQVNPAPSGHDGIATVILRGPAGEMLPRLLAKLR